MLLPLLVQAKEVEMKTTITDVTVFQSGAQVYRSGEVTIPAGEHDIVISDATALLKKESIQVKGEGDFTILSVDHQMVLEDIDNQKTKWPELESKQKELMRQMEELSVKIQVLNSEEKTINNLKDIATTTKGVTVEQVSRADDAIALRLTQVKNDKLKYSRQVLDLFEQYKEITQHLVALKTPRQRVRYEIVVKVLAKAEVKAKFSINYVVPAAGWTPAYDIRVKTVSDPMLIEYKANVSQQSGEDWSNVKLKLSTGDPSRTSTKPTIDAWWLYIDQPYSQPGNFSAFYDNTVTRFTVAKGVVVNSVTAKPLPWVSVMVPGTTVGTMTDAEGKFSLLLPGNATQLNFYCVGYSSGTLVINPGQMVARLSRLPMPLNETVKTDYEKQLMTLQSPIFDTDYEKELITLDVPVDPIYEKNGYYSSGDYMMKEMDNKMTMNYDVQKQVTDKNYSKSQYEMQTDMLVVKKALNIVSTEYSIDEKFTILSDPQGVSIPIQTIRVDARYQYFCAPRYDDDVFLTAQLVNWEQYNLIEGPANVFYEGTFIGNTLLDTRYLVDTLEISLGRDKGVKVERKRSKDYNRHQVVGSDDIVYREWDITARNTKQQPVDIIIQDQFPVSTDSKITVTQEEKGDGKLDEKTGIVSWTFHLDPSAIKNTALKYKVKHPKNSAVGLD